ncbi:MAG: STAS-like domain-containing protein [Candidatus Poribacteria bacterium]|nr:STAS-like domain-containing protein [Candidatus Poribacteria bacterium]
MSEEIRISIFEVVGRPLCVASGDGQKVYDRLNAALETGREVALSFRNVTTLTSAFLNAAIGQLYGTFSEEQVRAQLKVEDMEQDDLALLKRVVDNAKLYFKDPERFDKVVEETQENGDDESQTDTSRATQLYFER